MSERLPVTVIGGYLGAGKTTLVNHLLRTANGLRLAVLVNDFGALPIDRDLIVLADGDTLEISGGCVCCSYGSELMEALIDLPQRRPDLDAILIETSGVALPGMVANAVSLITDYRIDGILVLVDAETALARADDPYLGDTIVRQVAAADLVVVNRCDLASDATRARLAAWLETQAPQARSISTTRAALPLELALGIDRHSPATAPLHAPGAPAAAAFYDSIEITLPEPIDVEALARFLADPALGLLRAKGIIDDASGRHVTLQMVGARFEIEQAPETAQSGALVMIGLRGQLDRAAIERHVASMRQRAA